MSMPERVRVLLDESVPEKLRAAFSDRIAAETVRYRGWVGLQNGALLRAAEEDFDALLTVDLNLRHQQNLSIRRLAVVVLVAGGTTFADLLPLVPAAEVALLSATPGRVTLVGLTP